MIFSCGSGFRCRFFAYPPKTEISGRLSTSLEKGMQSLLRSSSLSCLNFNHSVILTTVDDLPLGGLVRLMFL